MVLVKGGEPCTCGRQGCLEAYASANALIRQTKQAAKDHPDSAIWTLCGGNPEQVTGRTAFDAAKQGDETGQQVVNTYLSYLGEGIVNLVNIFRPECVIIGGGICNEGARLIDPIQAFVTHYCLGHDKIDPPKIIKAALGNDAGIIGAALL